MKRTLIVIDMQNDFVNGSLGTKEAQAIVPNVKKKIEEYMKRCDQVIFTKDTHYYDYLDTLEGKCLPVKHCIRGTKGWEITDELCELAHARGNRFVEKETFGYEYWKYGGFDFKEIEIVGLCTDICVISNALILKAFYPEINITVDASCCAGVTPESHKAALIAMKSCQINVIGE